MDNITHSLIGVTVGQALVRSVPVFRENKKLADAAIWASVLGNNAPDLDIFQSWYLGGGKLGYLLYHRGQSHTLLALPLLAALATLLSVVFAGLRPGRSEWLKVFAVALLGVFLHLVADFGNDYGIHPFWPVWNGWIYGGYLFIIEPWVWIVTIPVLIFTFSSKTVRAIGTGLSFGLPILMILSHTIPVPLLIVLLVAQGTMLWIQSRSRSLRPAFIGLALILAAFVSGSLAVRGEITHDLAQAKPDETLVQIVTAPAPGNPFCWRTITVSRTASGTFADRTGYHSLLPWLFSPKSCFRMRPAVSPLLLDPSVPSSERHQWTAEFRGAVSDLNTLAATNCQFAAFLRWARVPIWSQSGNRGLLAADLRYETQPGLGFAGVDASLSKPCFEPVPPWTPPSALIDPSGLK